MLNANLELMIFKVLNLSNMATHYQLITLQGKSQVTRNKEINQMFSITSTTFSKI